MITWVPQAAVPPMLDPRDARGVLLLAEHLGHAVEIQWWSETVYRAGMPVWTGFQAMTAGLVCSLGPVAAVLVPATALNQRERVLYDQVAYCRLARQARCLNCGDDADGTAYCATCTRREEDHLRRVTQGFGATAPDAA